MTKKTRHILGLSGGKDSTALAILLHKLIPQLEFFFCDTGKELKETYDYLNRIEARLGVRIRRLSAERGFDHWLDMFGGMLPSPQVRWCTRQLKIIPLERYIGNDFTYSYIGIRADEEREGYISSKPNIVPVYPFKPLDFKGRNPARGRGYDQRKTAEELKKIGIELPIRTEGHKLSDIEKVLRDSGIGKPDYYRWRSRSGCFFCFFQRKYEWVRLAEEHPDLFREALAYEKSAASSRGFYWNERESLLDIVKRKHQIIAEHKRAVEKKKKLLPNRPLAEVLLSVLDDESGDSPCLICHL